MENSVKLFFKYLKLSNPNFSLFLRVQITDDQLEELEFPDLLAEISPFAFSHKIATKISELRPFSIDEAKTSLKKVSEFLSSFESDNAIPFNEYDDIETELKLMLIENFRLENSAFIKIKSLTEQIGKLQKFYPAYEEVFATLNNDVKDLDFRKEIIEKIGLAALKFFIVKVHPKKRMTFDPKESVDMQGQTGPYIQNAYVRVRSVLRKAEADGFAGSKFSDYKIQKQEKEKMQEIDLEGIWQAKGRTAYDETGENRETDSDGVGRFSESQ